MKLDELFDMVTTMIAYPHTDITEHDKRRAIQVFLAFDEYLTDAFGEVYWDKDGPFEDLCEYCNKQLDILEGK